MDALTRSLPTWSAAEYGRRLEAQRRGTLVQVVAWDGEVPIGRGHVLFPGHEQWSISAHRCGCAEVRDVFVEPERRREGAASAVMWMLEQVVRERGMARIGLSVSASEDARPAGRLYERLGYEHAHGPYVSSTELPGDEGPIQVGAVMNYLLKEL